MKRILLPILASVMMLASCDQKNDPTTHQPEDAENIIPVQVNIDNVVTKALTGSSKEKEIKSLKLFLYRLDSNGNRTFESYYDFSSSITGGTIYIDLSKEASSYQLAAYANHSTVSLSSFDKDWSLFENETPDNFQMFGEKIRSKAEIVAKPEFEISLKRQCSKVTVKEVGVKWTNSANAHKTFSIKGMYLMDVEGVFQNLHSVTGIDTKALWQNKGGHTSSGKDNLLYDKINDQTIANGSSYSTPHVFYGYISGYSNYNTEAQSGAGWVPDGTRLVIEADFDGKPCFYAVPINNTGLSDVRNKHFVFEKIIITKPGADSPYGELTVETALTVKINVEDWDIVNIDSYEIN